MDPTVPYRTPVTNCYSCLYANSTADRCCAPPRPGLIEWIGRTHAGAATCPAEASGCPAWVADRVDHTPDDLRARVDELEDHIAALEREL